MNQNDTSMRNDDYLWDRSGPVDLGVAKLELALGTYRFDATRRPSPDVSATTPPGIAARRKPPRRYARALLGAAALLVLAVAGASFWYHHRLQWPQAQSWRVTAVEGNARIDGAAITTDATLAPGRVLETGADASVRLNAARIGEIVVGAGSRFVLSETASGRHRVNLRQGSLWARVWAPPASFGVATPAGEMLDLGCEFVLRMQADGSGSLAVRSGWVMVDNARREVLVPQGARADFGRDGRAGTPYDLDASTIFRDALKRIDAEADSLAADASPLQQLADAARPQDAISLLSLLQAHPRFADGPIYARLARILPADTTPTRAAVRSGDRPALDAWWNALPYPRMKRWWMQWPDVFAAEATPQALLDDKMY